MTHGKLTLNDYQHLAQRTSNKDLSPDDHLMNGLLGLAGETGECCDLAKKCFYQDGRDIRDSLKDELGDVLWYVAEAATAMGWELEEIGQHNLDKLKRRYPEGFSAERSINRQEYGKAEPAATDSAIEVMLDGKAVSEAIHDNLARHAEK